MHKALWDALSLLFRVDYSPSYWYLTNLDWSINGEYFYPITLSKQAWTIFVSTWPTPAWSTKHTNSRSKMMIKHSWVWGIYWENKAIFDIGCKHTYVGHMYALKITNLVIPFFLIMLAPLSDVREEKGVFNVLNDISYLIHSHHGM